MNPARREVEVVITCSECGASITRPVHCIDDPDRDIEASKEASRNLHAMVSYRPVSGFSPPVVLVYGDQNRCKSTKLEMEMVEGDCWCGYCNTYKVYCRNDHFVGYFLYALLGAPGGLILKAVDRTPSESKSESSVRRRRTDDAHYPR